MQNLAPDEIRVLGVLIEKELTTPDLYPLTLNSTVNGCNQKNNRHPVTSLDESAVMTALDGLRDKGYVVFVDAIGARASKFRQQAQQALGIGVKELVILAELMLRGPQTVGEIRTRASRMHPLDSLDVVSNTLTLMMDRPEPLVRAVAPAPGSRAQRFAQLLCPQAHPLDAAVEEAARRPVALAAGAGELSQRVELLERRVASLGAALRKLADALGETDPLEQDMESQPAQPPEHT
ncbi:MAG: DUF480 domain-containing protein [Planctomycetes bacterium]|jgi:uncharacterized protein YceH (UPF0502 family)|nr:DUF480 domain-containing protein [Planctomycetota bacterium]